MTLERIASKNGYTVWRNTMNPKRKYQVYKGTVMEGKLMGSYKSINSLLKKYPRFKRKN